MVLVWISVAGIWTADNSFPFMDGASISPQYKMQINCTKWHAAGVPDKIVIQYSYMVGVPNNKEITECQMCLYKYEGTVAKNWNHGYVWAFLQVCYTASWCKIRSSLKRCSLQLHMI